MDNSVGFHDLSYSLDRLGFRSTLFASVMFVGFSILNFGLGAAWLAVYGDNQFLVRGLNPFRDTALRCFIITISLFGSAIVKGVNSSPIRRLIGILLLSFAAHQSWILFGDFPTADDRWLTDYSAILAYYRFTGQTLVALAFGVFLFDIFLFGRFLHERKEI